MQKNKKGIKQRKEGQPSLILFSFSKPKEISVGTVQMRPLNLISAQQCEMTVRALSLLFWNRLHWQYQLFATQNSILPPKSLYLRKIIFLTPGGFYTLMLRKFISFILIDIYKVTRDKEDSRTSLSEVKLYNYILLSSIYLSVHLSIHPSVHQLFSVPSVSE